VAADSLQLSSGQPSECEAVVHVVKSILEEDYEAILLVNASDAFSSLNRQIMLHNILIICPTIATFTSNC